MVTLEVTNQAGSLTSSKSVVVGPTPTPTPTPSPGPTPTPSASPSPSPTPVVCQAPTARFTYTSSGKTYQFTDLSTVNSPTCPITTWFWEFGDGETATNSINPTHTYKSANSHTVTLTVTNIAGSRSWSSTQ
jgi:PKD repeat protein